MAEQDQGQDAHMQVMDWEGGEEMDEEFRTGDCVEVELESEDDVYVDSEGDEGIEENPEQEVGVIDESQIYSDDEAQPSIDDSLASMAHKDSVQSVAFCPVDRHALVTGGQDDVAVLWSVEERSGSVRCVQRSRLEGHTDTVIEAAFSHDGIYVATGSYDGTVKIWAAATGALVHSLDGPSKEIEWILWHPKGHAILAGSADTMAWMWWAPTGKLMQIFAGHAQSVTCGCWGLGGKLICTGSEDRGIIVWNPRTGAPQQQVRQVHESAVTCICSHPEAPIVVTGSEDSGAKVMQMETGKVLANLSGHMDSVECVGFNNPVAGGLLLLATASMDGKVMVWDGRTYDLRCTLTDHFERGGIVRFKWLPPSPYSAWLCTCATDHTLRLFNGLSGACVRTLRGHKDTVLGLDLALSSAEAGPMLHVASASDDKSSRVFSVALWTAGEAHNAGPQAAVTAAPRAASASETAETLAAAGFSRQQGEPLTAAFSPAGAASQALTLPTADTGAAPRTSRADGSPTALPV